MKEKEGWSLLGLLLMPGQHPLLCWRARPPGQQGPPEELCSRSHASSRRARIYAALLERSTRPPDKSFAYENKREGVQWSAALR